MKIDVIILAGGLGTRLKSVVTDIPKPMADVSGKPFLFYLLKYLSRYKVSSVVMAVGYKHETIERYFGNKFLGIPIKYSIEKSPLGTGGAIFTALKQTVNEEILILNGDTFFNIDLELLISTFHTKNNIDMIIAIRYMELINRYGLINIDKNNRIIGFVEKTDQLKSGFINGGIYLFNKNTVLNDFNELNLGVPKFSFEEYLINSITSRFIYGLPSNGYFIDIGVPEDYLRAKLDIPSLNI